MSAGYYRFSTVHGDKLVFVSEDDLWTTTKAGGIARRLTSNLGSITFPMLSPDGAWLAFVGREEGSAEVYVMPAVGGSARRLTYLSSSCRVVGWMPGGKEIIFCSNYGQVIQNEFALFTIAYDSENGLVTQLPYGPARTITHGPTGGAILGRNTQDSSRWKRYRGGTAGHLWIDRTGAGEFTRFLDNLPGNVAAPMWIQLPTTATPPANVAESAGAQQGAMATESRPITQERIFFVSDHEGIGNLYSCTVQGDELRRHTDHADYYVRNPSTDGRHIVYQAGADLFLYDLATDQSQLVPITYYSPRVQRNRRFADAGRFLEDAVLHPDGKSLALATRGKAFAFYNHEGPVLQYGARNGVRYRLPEWTTDGRHIVLISDEIGEETIEIHPTNPQGTVRRLQGLDIGRAVAMKLSPVADIVAIANHRHELLLVDLTTEKLLIVDHSPHGLIAGFDWSPDGRWLAYGYGVSTKLIAIRLYRLADPTAKEEALQQSAIHTITQPVLRDVNPAFDPEGKYLYFLSYREFNPVYDNLHFELGFPWGMRPYLITLRADLPNPFIPFPGTASDEEAEADEEADEGDEESDEEGADEDGDDALATDSLDGEADDDAEDEGAEDEQGDEGEGGESEGLWSRRRAVNAEKTPPATPPATTPAVPNEQGQPTPAKSKATAKGSKIKRVRIDLAGIEQRVLAFPVPDGRYGQIAGVEGKALFTVLPIEGALDDGNEWDDELPETGTLRSYNFKEFKTETLAENVAWFQIARNYKRLLYSGRRRLRVIAAGEKPQSESGPGRRTGWIDLSRVKVSIDPQREWEQMFREAWRLQRDHFWTEDMSQVDWLQIYQRYFPLIERVSTRGEFSDLMWEMQGELGTSHAYEYGGDYRPQPYYGQGFLGTTFAWDAQAGGYRVEELLIGDPWQPSSSSPLAAPGVDVHPGDLLIAINGQTLDAQTSPAHLLVNQAGQDILLTFAARPTVATTAQAELATTGVADTTLLPPTGELDHAVANATNAKTPKATPPTIFEAAQAEDTTPLPASEMAATGSLPPILEVGPSEQAVGQRSVIVRAIYEEASVRYRRWIDANRRFVHEATGGRAGYVHIPDMGPRGYAEFHRGYLAEVGCDALIVDVRYNAGGHVSQLILEKLARRRLGYDLSRWGGLDPYPADSVAGPLVALTNEHAGSDGDIFCHSFKLMKLGPLIGKRTWGGVVGISPRHVLVDGTITTQPEFSFWFEDVGWNLENYGTEPDIEVDIRPQDYRQGVDPQLQRGVDEVLRLLAAHPLTKPDLTTRPSRALPQLPPRLIQ